MPDLRPNPRLRIVKERLDMIKITTVLETLMMHNQCAGPWPEVLPSNSAVYPWTPTQPESHVTCNGPALSPTILFKKALS
jgi:hypothetical protein